MQFHLLMHSLTIIFDSNLTHFQQQSTSMVATYCNSGKFYIHNNYVGGTTNFNFQVKLIFIGGTTSGKIRKFQNYGQGMLV